MNAQGCIWDLCCVSRSTEALLSVCKYVYQISEIAYMVDFERFDLHHDVY
jgi:hypothetical protein